MLLGTTCLDTFILDEEIEGTWSSVTKEERSVKSIKISLIQTEFACKRLCKFRSLGRDRESQAIKTIELTTPEIP